MSIDNIKANARLGRKIYNERALKKKVVKKAVTDTGKPAPAKDRSDPALSMAFAEARGCPDVGRAEIANKLGTLNELKAALGARYDRAKELFGDAPVR
jgi:hypothetical protein